MMNLDAGASKEAPFLVEADASSDSPEEAQPYVYPPHLDGLRTHGDEVDVDSIMAVAALEWPTSAFAGAIVLCWLAFGLFCLWWGSALEKGDSFQFYLFGVPLACVVARLTAKATVGIMINRGYYAKGPEWDVSLGPQPKPRSLAFVLTALVMFSFVTVQAYFYLKGSRPEPALTDLLVLVPWTYTPFS
jgi:fatty acid desaturase